MLLRTVQDMFLKACILNCPSCVPQLHGLVSRRRYGELPERELQGRKLQRSALDVRFHIRDLVGMGMLERVQTTSGVILRAPKHKA